MRSLELFSIYGKIGLEDNDFHKKIDAATDSGERFNLSLSSIVKAAAGLGVVKTAWNSINTAVSGAMTRIDTIERFTRTMTVLTGSAEASEAALAKVTETVTGTAYGLVTAANAVQSFVTSGMDISLAADNVATFADAVAFYSDGTNASLESVSNAFSKIYTSGKVSAQNLQTILYAGIPVYDIYAEAAGLSIEEVQKAFQSGEVAAEEFINVLTTALNEGTESFPSIAGAAEEAGASWSATFDNMQADVTRAVTNIIQQLDDNLTQSGLPTLREGLRSTSRSFASFLESAGEVGIEIVKFTAPAVRGLANSLTVLLPAAVSAVAAFKGYNTIKAFSDASKSASAVLDVLKTSMNLETIATQANIGAKELKAAVEAKGYAVSEAGQIVTAKGIVLEEKEALALLASTGALTKKQVAMLGLTGQTTKANAITAIFNNTLFANPAVQVALAVGVLVVAAGALGKALSNAASEAKEMHDASRELSEQSRANADAYREESEALRTQRAAMDDLIVEFLYLEGLYERTDDQIARQIVIVETLNETYDSLNITIDEYGNLVGITADQVRNLMRAEDAEAQVALQRARLAEIPAERRAAEEALTAALEEQARIEEARAESNGRLSLSNYRLSQSLLDITQTVNELRGAIYGLDVEYKNVSSGLIDGLESQKVAVEATADIWVAANGQILDSQADVIARNEELVVAATDMYSELTDAVETYARDYLATQENNLEVTERWLENLDTLTERGIDEGYLERLRAAGPASAAEVAAWANATDEEIARLNQNFERGGELIYGTTTDAIEDTTAAFIEALNDEDFLESGSNAMTAIANLIDENDDVMDAVLDSAEDAKDAGLESAETFEEIGEAMSDGIVEGIEAGRSSVVDALVASVLEGIKAAKKTAGINSPSRVMYDEVGMNMMLGWMNAVGDSTGEVAATFGRVAEQSIEAAQTEFSPNFLAALSSGPHNIVRPETPAYTTARDVENMLADQFAARRQSVNVTLRFDGTMGQLVRTLKPELDAETIRTGGSLTVTT